MAEIATAVASKAAAEVAAEAAKPLLARARRRCGYVIFSKRYVGQLDEELKKLKNAMDRVRHSVDYAEHNMKLIEADVENWVKEAETVAQKAGDVLAHKAGDVLDDEGRAKKTCFCGWLPNPKGRYCLGRDARKTAEAIQELIPQGRFEKVYYENAPPALVERAAAVNSSACVGGDTIQELNARGQFEKVDFENPPPVLVGVASGVNSSASDGGDFITGSRASIFQDMMKALDDEKLKVIGVYGPGGVGKTTLLKEVEKKLREAGRPFRMIVKVEVSQNPDLNKIIDQIADALSLDLKDKQSPQGKADVLSKRLKRDPNETFLIIFDNLWEKVDLEAVGIPREDVSSKCKLLLTSRFEDVLEQEMGADRTFLLQGLKDNEAFRLFENKVGDKLKGNEGLKSIADQVVKKLAGLPLLIISVATTLKSSDESAWRNALIEIDDSNKEKKETIVRLSYDHLKSKDAKYLFLLCGLIGGTIQVELLFVLAMGLGLFERFNKTIQASRDRLNDMLSELRSACLLLDGGNDTDSVTIHDLYSEAVVSDAFSGPDSLMINKNDGLWPKEKLEKCWACLVNVGNDKLAELMLRQFPHVKILMLSEQTDMRDRSRIDFTYMEELRVLYLRSMHITSLPSSMEILGNLQSLSINCHVEDVANLGKLKALQILSFAWSTISRLPKEIGELTNLRSLNLSNCEELQRIEPGVLKRLINLEELHMKGSFNRWMGKNDKPLELCNVGLAELKSMTKLNSLEISIHDPIILLEVDNLPFENLTRFWINIGNIGGREYERLTTMKLNLEGCGSILSRKWVKKNLQKTQYLYLSKLSEFKESPREFCTQGFQEVKYLDIKDSPSFKYIAYSSNDHPLNAFGKLESFSLDNLINLEKICHGPIEPNCFRKLKTVSVGQCNRLKYLWCLLDMQILVQLEEIDVLNCDSMQSIVTHDAGVGIVSTDNRVELPNIRCLRLFGLPNMTSFCTKAEITSEDTPIQVTFPNIRSLKVEGLQCKELWNNQIPDHSFWKLGSLELKDCNNLQRIAPSYVWKRLHRSLRMLKVSSCRSIEIIFEGDGTDIECGKLWRLVLHDLRNLRDIWQSDGLLNVPFPNLREVEAVRCSRLEMLFPTFTVKFLGQIKELIMESCENMELIAGHEIGEEATRTTITFSKLIALRLFKLPKFKGILLERYSLKLLEAFPSLQVLSLADCGAEQNLRRLSRHRYRIVKN
ncbi:hypothetical protein EUGRSUZ_G00544, partial [Eucalyptus grandis]